MRALINKKLCFFFSSSSSQAYYPNWTHKDTQWKNSAVTPQVKSPIVWPDGERKGVRVREKIQPQRGSAVFLFNLVEMGIWNCVVSLFKAGKWVTKGYYNSATQIGFHTALRLWTNVKNYNWIKLPNRSFVKTAFDTGFLDRGNEVEIRLKMITVLDLFILTKITSIRADLLYTSAQM